MKVNLKGGTDVKIPAGEPLLLNFPLLNMPHSWTMCCDGMSAEQPALEWKATPLHLFIFSINVIHLYEKAARFLCRCGEWDHHTDARHGGPCAQAVPGTRG